MPSVLKVGRYRFFFYSREGTEPAHIHVDSAEKMAKYWLKDVVELAYNDGFRSGELSEILEIVEERKSELLEAWNAHFTQ